MEKKYGKNMEKLEKVHKKKNAGFLIHNFKDILLIF